MPTTAFGVPGVVAGVAADEFAEYEPVPTAFTLATRNTYLVPLVSLVTVAVVAADAACVKVCHDDPLVLLYWIV